LKYISDLNKNVDCILLGRVLAEGFIPHWKMEATDPTKKRDFVKEMSEQYDFAKKMYETKKVVFSKSLKNSEWENTVLTTGDLETEINKLKNQSGEDIIAYGGAAFVSSLIKTRLVDEFHLFVNPAAIGNGMTIFKELESKQDFNLISATSFECGIVVIHYQPKRS
jgi:dihydrofolate reductase